MQALLFVSYCLLEKKVLEILHFQYAVLEKLTLSSPANLFSSLSRRLLWTFVDIWSLFDSNYSFILSLLFPPGLIIAFLQNLMEVLHFRY